MSDNEKVLIAALKTLAANETRGPSPMLEGTLLRAMRGRRPTWVIPAGLAALAAAVTLVAVLFPRSEKLMNPALPTVAPPTIHITEREPVVHLPEAPQRVSIVRKRRPVRQTALTVPREREQDSWIRIPYSETLEPTDRAELVRVSMPAAQLLSWGFPISGTDPNFRIDTDVLVGGDGLARAVRFTRTGATK